MHTAYGRWLALSIEAWALGVESSAVIALRIANAVAGRDLDGREARLMVHEKIVAAAALQTAMMTGQLGLDPAVATQRVIRNYTRKVRANRERLCKA